MSRRKPKPRRMTDAELQEFVRDYLAGLIWTTEDVPPGDAPLVFMPLMFMDKKAAEEMRDTAGAVYGSRRKHKTTGMAVNGNPIFIEIGVVGKEDWKILADTINREKKKHTEIVLEK